MAVSNQTDRLPLVLASGSPRREKLIKLFNIPFTVHPSPVEESFDAAQSPGEIVQSLALRKARDIARHYSGAVVLGADTIVVHKQQILGKPDHPRQAADMLMKLSDSTHQVYTGVALVRSGPGGGRKQCTFAESTDVTFGKLDRDAVERYVSGGSPMDKAGGYGIQDDWGAIFVKRIEGDYYNIVGLPLHTLYHQMKDFAPGLLK